MILCFILFNYNHLQNEDYAGKLDGIKNENMWENKSWAIC